MASMAARLIFVVAALSAYIFTVPSLLSLSVRIIILFAYYVNR